MDYVDVLREEGAMDVHCSYHEGPLPFHKYKIYRWVNEYGEFYYRKTFIDDIKQITYYIFEKEGN